MTSTLSSAFAEALPRAADLDGAHGDVTAVLWQRPEGGPRTEAIEAAHERGITVGQLMDFVSFAKCCALLAP